jgi:hypothetical protein
MLARQERICRTANKVALYIGYAVGTTEVAVSTANSALRPKECRNDANLARPTAETPRETLVKTNSSDAASHLYELVDQPRTASDYTVATFLLVFFAAFFFFVFGPL